MNRTTTAAQRVLCDLLGMALPICGAPMAHISGGALAAAVTDAGGLGFIGGGYGDLGWIDEQLALTGGRRVGMGLITWVLDDRPELIPKLLERGVGDVWLSFGDPAPHIAALHDGGALAICQVQTVEEASRARDAGADVIVAQGSEAGGHGRDNDRLAVLLPAVVEAVRPAQVPVLAAGGISTGRHLHAAFALGAAGVVLGTRLYASHEALDTERAKQLLVNSSGRDTARTTIFDLVRGPEWPEGYTGRAIINDTVSRWSGREDGLRNVLAEERSRYARAAVDDDVTRRVVWAGTGVGDIREIASAGDIVRHIANDAARQ